MEPEPEDPITLPFYANSRDAAISESIESDMGSMGTIGGALSINQVDSANVLSNTTY
jgi:hypothetical protein